MKPLSALAIVALVLAAPAQALAEPYHHHHHHHRHYRQDCLRFNKTTGTVAGAAVGGLAGDALIGGPAGVIVGAAGGGLAGHHLARDGRKRCH